MVRIAGGTQPCPARAPGPSGAHQRYPARSQGRPGQLACHGHAVHVREAADREGPRSGSCATATMIAWRPVAALDACETPPSVGRHVRASGSSRCRRQSGPAGLEWASSPSYLFPWRSASCSPRITTSSGRRPALARDASRFRCRRCGDDSNRFSPQSSRAPGRRRHRYPHASGRNGRGIQAADSSFASRTRTRRRRPEPVLNPKYVLALLEGGSGPPRRTCSRSGSRISTSSPERSGPLPKAVR